MKHFLASFTDYSPTPGASMVALIKTLGIIVLMISSMSMLIAFEENEFNY